MKGQLFVSQTLYVCVGHIHLKECACEVLKEGLSGESLQQQLNTFDTWTSV